MKAMGERRSVAEDGIVTVTPPPTPTLLDPFFRNTPFQVEGFLRDCCKTESQPRVLAETNQLCVVAAAAAAAEEEELPSTTPLLAFP